jgi:hypothetical protein
VDVFEGGAPDRFGRRGSAVFHAYDSASVFDRSGPDGWEVHAIATFAGRRHTDSTLAYIHFSGRDLADRLARGMDHVHAWRIVMLSGMDAAASGASR